MSTHPFRSDAREGKKRLRWAEVPVPPRTQAALVNEANSYVRAYTLGLCHIIVTKEYGNWHMSISHPMRYPTWDEVADARYRSIPESVWMAMVLPPPDHYINLHPNCFQLVEIPEQETR
jgi:hypothetical protein